MAILKARAFIVALLLCGLAGTAAEASQVNVAVAANFTAAAKALAAAFKARTGEEAVLSFGASGQLYGQITQAAPFEILLSADDERPKKAIAEGFGVAGSRFTYAIGKLVLWSRSPDLVKGEATLRDGGFAKLSIADPKAAPYGAAAVETLQALHLFEALKPKIVEGSSIAQAFQFVDTGNAELGFVALAQLPPDATGSRWLVPQNLYAPIRQDAVLLKTGAGDPAAIAFLSFLKTPEAKAIIEGFGYAVPPEG